MVRITDRPDITSAFNRGRISTNKTKQKYSVKEDLSMVLNLIVLFI